MTDTADALARSVDIVTLLTNYGVKLNERGSEYQALCIWHSETKPSMSVFEGDDGKWRLFCHSCGAKGDAIDIVEHMDNVTRIEAINRLKANHFIRDDTKVKAAKPIKPNKWQHTVATTELTDFDIPKLIYQAHWTYRDADGALLGYVVRYTNEQGEKDYRPWTFGSYSANVKPVWKSAFWTSGRRPIYGLDKLAAKPKAKVLLCEGEKTADAAQVLLPDMVCISWPGGANGIRAVDWTPLRGRNILLVPDADIAGEKAMEVIAGYLFAIECTVRRLDTSDQPKAWDLADALEQGWTSEDVAAFAKSRITPLTSIELEKQQENPPTVLPQPDDMPPTATLLEGEALEIPDIQPANVVPIKPHTGIKETTSFNPLDPAQFFSHSHLAQLWVDKNPDWIYCTAWGKWLNWDGSRWEIDERKSINWAVTQEMKSAGTWLESMSLSVKDRRALANIANIKSVMEAASCIPSVVRIGDDFDADPMLLGTPEGVVDLRTGELREPDRMDMITKQTLVAPKRGEHPTWDKVIKRATKGDNDVAAYFQRWWGYMLTGSCKEESMLMCVGAGASGKTKYLMVADILGDYLQEADIGMLMESKVERHSSELASLEGARIVRCTEPEEGSRFNESVLKRLTGREKIAARKLYSEVHTYNVQFKIVLGSNFRPSLKSTGEEIRRRIHFVDFPDSIPEAERDYDLDKKLEQEYPAILQWMIDGCIEWQRIGLAKPDAVKLATADYLDEEDTLGHWIVEKCVTGKGHKVLSGDAYKSYGAYVDAHGEGVVSQKRFSQRLEGRGYGKAKDGKGKRWILGIDIQPEGYTPPAPHDDEFGDF